MSELEEKLGSVLSNPQLMQQIREMAQSLGSQPPPPEAPQSPPPEPGGLDFDPALLEGLAKFARCNQVDNNQRTLLHALVPYLSQQRVNKLERAMRASQLATAASAFLNAGGLQKITGR